MQQRARIDWLIEDGEDATRSLATGAAGYYRRIKNAWKLSPRQLAVLIAICDWREETARSRDKPRSWIIDDKACLQLALEQPLTLSELKYDVELPAPAVRRYGDTLVDLIGLQQGLGESDLPPRLPAPLNAGQRNQLKALKSQTSKIAEQLGVAPQVLLLSKDYETLLRRSPDEPAYWNGWRRELVIEPLKASLGEAS